jgi:alkyldihydroxyacetonephosphate synthase
MRWWGWGDPAHPPTLDDAALAFLREHVGVLDAPRPPVALDAVGLEPAALPEAALAALREVLGEQGVRVDHRERVLHAAGKSYPDLVKLRAGMPDGAPDAVLHPSARPQLRALLEVCARHSLAVVPFGGGTSVVGGVAPLRSERQHAAVALDLGQLSGVIALDRESLTVSVRAGMRAVALERELARQGLTLGHFPQSFEYVSLGGCAATRSAGQASTGYGRFEELVQGLVLLAPVGDIELAAIPATAAGPELRRVVVGSEGTLGVIAELSLRVRPAPARRLYEGVFFRDFAAGAQALRALAQEHCAPAVSRLSDEAETSMSLALAGSGPRSGAGSASGSVKRRLGRIYLGARGYAEGCLAILGFEGTEEEVAHRRKRALRVVRSYDGLPVGRSPGEAWLRQRFAAPYLRDELLTHGVMVETLETATQWSNLERLHRQLGEAIAQSLRAQGTPGLVMCHVSHLYDTGASLYFTFLARQRDGQEIAQWQAVKQAACAAIVDGGGTITHHHAIGRDHASWLEREIGHTGLAALRGLKAQLDPEGIMNPGKLLDVSAG